MFRQDSWFFKLRNINYPVIVVPKSEIKRWVTMLKMS